MDIPSKSRRFGVTLRNCSLDTCYIIFSAQQNLLGCPYTYSFSVAMNCVSGATRWVKSLRLLEGWRARIMTEIWYASYSSISVLRAWSPNPRVINCKSEVSERQTLSEWSHSKCSFLSQSPYRYRTIITLYPQKTSHVTIPRKLQLPCVSERSLFCSDLTSDKIFFASGNRAIDMFFWTVHRGHHGLMWHSRLQASRFPILVAVRKRYLISQC